MRGNTDDQVERHWLRHELYRLESKFVNMAKEIHFEAGKKMTPAPLLSVAIIAIIAIAVTQSTVHIPGPPQIPESLAAQATSEIAWTSLLSRSMWFDAIVGSP